METTEMPTTSVTVVPTVGVTASSPDNSAPSDGPLGTLTMTIGADDAVPTVEQLDVLVERLRDLIDSLGAVGASVTNDGEQVVVVLEHLPDISGRFAELLPDPQVQVRPVLQCFATSGGIVHQSTPGEPIEPASEGEVLPMRDGNSCFVGPIAATGAIFEPDAVADISGGGWAAVVSLRPGADGVDPWNAVASRCFRGDETCPSRQLAIVISGVIVSAPTVNADRFSGNIEISGDFSESDAAEIARTLRVGADPVEFMIQDSTFVPD
jgi:hypothetical protein